MIPELVGAWRVTEIDGDPVVDASPVLELDDDGHLSGTGGVNRLVGHVRAEGSTVTFGPVGSTMMAGPPAAMAVEDRVTRLLEGTFDAESPTPGRWVLRGPRGTFTLEATTST